jgi:signal transduction histidine kinase
VAGGSTCQNAGRLVGRVTLQTAQGRTCDERSCDPIERLTLPQSASAPVAGVPGCHIRRVHRVCCGQTKITRATLRTCLCWPGMPRSPATVLTARLDRINALANDLARANGGESVTQAFADAIKREVDGVSRALRRPQRSFTGAQLAARPDRSVVSVEQDTSDERRLREQMIHSERLSAVGQLVAGVAHEINNSLQAVMGITELRDEQFLRYSAGCSV